MSKIYLAAISPHNAIKAICSKCNNSTEFSGSLRVRTEDNAFLIPQYQCQSCGQLTFNDESITPTNEIGGKRVDLVRVALSKKCDCGGQYRRDKNIFCPCCQNRHDSAENICDFDNDFISEIQFRKLING